MKRIVVATVVVAAAAPAALAGGAPVALPIPAKRICGAGDAAIRVGVRYTHDPAGPRRFELEIRDPAGHRVLHRHGIASPRWRIWRYDPPARAIGVYRTTYRLAWATHAFRTRVLACRS